MIHIVERLQKEAEEALAAGKQLKGGMGDVGGQGKKSSSGALTAVEVISYVT